MLNELQIFKYSGKNVRTVIKDSEPWFVAKDVCAILELSDVSMSIQRLNSKMRGTSSICTLGGKQDMSVVSEAGVYKLVFTSRKPEAEKFTDWLAEEVLPSIRKHGMYAKDELLDDLDLLITVAQDLKVEREKRKKLESQKLLLENTLEENKPKVAFAERILKSKDNILIRQYSKVLQDEGILNMGEKKLFYWLRFNKYLSFSNEPFQRYVPRYFIYEENTYDTPYGTKISHTTKITPEGQIYIFNKIQEQVNSGMIKIKN